MGQGLHIPSGDSPWTHLNCASCSLFPCSPSSSLGLLKGRWARVVGGLFFTQGSGRTPNCSACLLPSSLPAFCSPCLPAPVLPGLRPPTLPSPPAPCPSSLPGDLFCFLLCFFFCFECLSLQVSVAGRSRSQRLQCKFPLPLGKCTTLFWGVWGCFCFSGVFVLFYFFFLYLFFPFYLEGMGGSGNRVVGVAFVFIFLTHFQGMGIFFLNNVS